MWTPINKTCLRSWLNPQNSWNLHSCHQCKFGLLAFKTRAHDTESEALIDSTASQRNVYNFLSRVSAILTYATRRRITWPIVTVWLWHETVVHLTAFFRQLRLRREWWVTSRTLAPPTERTLQALLYGTVCSFLIYRFNSWRPNITKLSRTKIACKSRVLFSARFEHNWFDAVHNHRCVFYLLLDLSSILKCSNRYRGS